MLEAWVRLLTMITILIGVVDRALGGKEHIIPLLGVFCLGFTVLAAKAAPFPESPATHTTQEDYGDDQHQECRRESSDETPSHTITEA